MHGRHSSSLANRKSEPATNITALSARIRRNLATLQTMYAPPAPRSSGSARYLDPWTPSPLPPRRSSRAGHQHIFSLRDLPPHNRARRTKSSTSYEYSVGHTKATNPPPPPLGSQSRPRACNATPSTNNISPQLLTNKLRLPHPTLAHHQ